MINNNYYKFSKSDYVSGPYSPLLLHDFYHEDEEDAPLDKLREEMIKFHVQHDDYFGTLATIINIIVEDKNIDARKMLRKYVADLVYLQKNYKIIKRK